MEVPERLALIGGGILLSSTLIFTLKSQASNILPKVEHPISSIYDHAGDAARGNSFPSDFKDAQRNGEQTGQWGTAKYYIDNNMNMHIGAGQLQGKLYDIVGDKSANNIKTINLDGNIQAPSDSMNLFVGGDYHSGSESYKNESITAINGLDRLDTSHVTNMTDMFYHDNALSNDLAVSNWDTSNVVFLAGTFGHTNINHLNIKNWDVKNVQNTSYFVAGDTNLTNLDLSGWHTTSNLNFAGNTFSTSGIRDLDMSNFNTSNVIKNNISNIFADTPLSKVTLGNSTLFQGSYELNGTWKNGSQSLSGTDLTTSQTAHPGTWVKQ